MMGSRSAVVPHSDFEREQDRLAAFVSEPVLAIAAVVAAVVEQFEPGTL
jgi:hypothetical protein